MTKLPKRGPDDPAEWLKRAKISLIQAKTRPEDVYLEDLCFNARQAVEKALKALLIKLGGKFPFTHDIVRLNTEIEKKLKPLPIELEDAEFLSAYSVASRYPGWDEQGFHFLGPAVTVNEALPSWLAHKLKPTKPGVEDNGTPSLSTLSA